MLALPLACLVRHSRFCQPGCQEGLLDPAKRLIDAYKVEEPDRVPVSINIDAMPMYQYGLDYNTGIHDYEKMRQAYDAFNQKHAVELEMYAGPPSCSRQSLRDTRLQTVRLAGHGLPSNGEGYQFVEGQYMKDDEYDAFIRDPSDFWIRTFLPRAFGAFEPIGMFGSATTVIETVAGIALFRWRLPRCRRLFRNCRKQAKSSPG